MPVWTLCIVVLSDAVRPGLLSAGRDVHPSEAVVACVSVLAVGGDATADPPTRIEPRRESQPPSQNSDPLGSRNGSRALLVCSKNFPYLEPLYGIEP